MRGGDKSCVSGEVEAVAVVVLLAVVGVSVFIALAQFVSVTGSSYALPSSVY